jgi:possible esterase
MVDKYKIYSDYLNKEITYNFLANPDSDIFIYFFDGQNLFHLEDAYMDATFGMKEALDQIGITANVVGIFAPYDDNRTNEYTPYKEIDYNAPEYFDMDLDYNPLGIKTGKFIVEELIPQVEKSKPVSTRLIGGASLVGLMSLYMGATYPKIFPAVLAMSSHFNINLIESGRFLDKFDDKKQKVYLDVGDNKYKDNKILTQSYIDINKIVAGFLVDKVDIMFRVYEDATHHERDWAKRMPEALEFLLKDN